jgi:hypothetical protein
MRIAVPGQGRLGDKGNVQLDAHGCPAWPHPAIARGRRLADGVPSLLRRQPLTDARCGSEMSHQLRRDLHSFPGPH